MYKLGDKLICIDSVDDHKWSEFANPGDIFTIVNVFTRNRYIIKDDKSKKTIYVGWRFLEYFKSIHERRRRIIEKIS